MHLGLYAGAALSTPVLPSSSLDEAVHVTPREVGPYPPLEGDMFAKKKKMIR